MADVLHEDRNGCALHGAIKALSAVEALVPVLHASSGCSIGARYGENTLAGSLSNAIGWLETSSTNLQEKHVVFGGTSRLREQLKNTVKVVKGELYTVVTGCVPEVVGDDVPAMVKESREQRYPTIGIMAPGFKGNGWFGYAATVRQVLEQLPTLGIEPRQVKTDLVNLLGIAPGLDPFWEGDLEEVAGALESIGLSVNRLFGAGERPAAWQGAHHAALNVVLSPWGLEAAEFLKTRDGIPFLDFGFLPVGSRDLGALVSSVAKELGLPEDASVAFAKAQDARQRYNLRKAAPALLSGKFQRRTAVVAGSSAAVGIARFLSGTLGQIVTTLVVTDNPLDEVRTAIVNQVREASEGIEIDVHFADSAAQVRQILSEAKPELVLGSALERSWTTAHGAALVEVAGPLREELVLEQRLAGTTGALQLVSRIARSLTVAGLPAVSGIRPEDASRGAERTKDRSSVAVGVA